MRIFALLIALIVSSLLMPYSVTASSHAKHAIYNVRTHRSTKAPPERTESVHGYRRKDGKYVQPYKRAPRGQGTKKKRKKP